MYVLVWPNFSVAAHTSGWLSRIHRMEHSEEPPVTGRLQVSRRNFSSPTRARMARACSMRPPVEEQDRRAERRAVRGHRRQPRRGDGQRNHAHLPEVLAHLRAAFPQRLPPLLGLDIRLAPVVHVDFVGARRFALLLEVRGEDGQLERCRPHVQGEDVAASRQQTLLSQDPLEFGLLRGGQRQQRAAGDAALEARPGSWPP